MDAAPSTAPTGTGRGMYALITGGGTGGHVYPALALAQELVGRGHAPDTLRFVGSERGLEAEAVPAAGSHPFVRTAAR